MNNPNDKTLHCQWKDEDMRICADEFTWRAHEQEFYKEKGYRTPKYCLRHREARKAQQKEREEEIQRRESSSFKPILDQMGAESI